MLQTWAYKLVYRASRTRMPIPLDVKTWYFRHLHENNAQLLTKYAGDSEMVLDWKLLKNTLSSRKFSRIVFSSDAVELPPTIALNLFCKSMLVINNIDPLITISGF